MTKWKHAILEWRYISRIKKWVGDSFKKFYKFKNEIFSSVWYIASLPSRDNRDRTNSMFCGFDLAIFESQNVDCVFDKFSTFPKRLYIIKRAQG